MNEYAAGITFLVDNVFIQDSSSTTGTGKASLAYNTAGLTCYYKRSDGTASVSVTLVDITTLGTYVSGGFKAIDGTNMIGLYEFHPPNAAFASGAKEVTFFFTGTGIAPRPIKYRLFQAFTPDTAYNLFSGVVVTGTSTTAVIVSGIPSGKNFKYQYLYDPSCGEKRLIVSHSYAGGNYTFTLNSSAIGGNDTTGPFDAAPPTGGLIYLI